MGELSRLAENRGGAVKLVAVTSMLVGKRINIQGNVLALSKGFINPHKHVYVSFNEHNEAARQKVLPGQVIAGTVYKSIYVWTDSASSIDGAKIEFIYGFDIFPDVKGGVSNPVFIQKRRTNYSVHSAPTLLAGGAAHTVSVDDPMRDIHSVTFVVHGPGPVYIALLGIATTGHIKLEPDPTKVHTISPESSTFSFIAGAVDDCLVTYEALGYEAVSP